MADHPQQRSAPVSAHGQHPATQPSHEKHDDPLVAVVALADITLPRLIAQEKDASGKVISATITQAGGMVKHGETVHVRRSIAENWIETKIAMTPKDAAAAEKAAAEK